MIEDKFTIGQAQPYAFGTPFKVIALTDKLVMLYIMKEYVVFQYAGGFQAHRCPIFSGSRHKTSEAAYKDFYRRSSHAVLYMPEPDIKRNTNYTPEEKAAALKDLIDSTGSDNECFLPCDQLLEELLEDLKCRN